MPPLTSLTAFAVLAFVLIIVPGPSVLFVISRAVALGRRAAVLTVVGNAVGVFAQVVAVAVGLGAVLSRSIAALTLVKLAGAAYLVWLGVKAIRDRHLLAATSADGSQRAFSNRSVFIDGVVVGVTNPKSIVFFAAVLPQFVDPRSGGVGLQMAVLGVVFVVIAVVSDSIWAVAAGTARSWLATSSRRLARLSVGGGAAMIGLGAHLAVSGRTD